MIEQPQLEREVDDPAGLWWAPTSEAQARGSVVLGEGMAVYSDQVAGELYVMEPSETLKSRVRGPKTL